MISPVNQLQQHFHRYLDILIIQNVILYIMLKKCWGHVQVFVPIIRPKHTNGDTLMYEHSDFLCFSPDSSFGLQVFSLPASVCVCVCVCVRPIANHEHSLRMENSEGHRQFQESTHILTMILNETMSCRTMYLYLWPVRGNKQTLGKIDKSNVI